jgi:hypothetical protein
MRALVLMLTAKEEWNVLEGERVCGVTERGGRVRFSIPDRTKPLPPFCSDSHQ